MSKLPMSFACGLYDRMQPLYTGEVQPVGIDLNFMAIDNPREIFDRMAGRTEFDACEMSSSEYVTRFAANKCPFIAIPAFPSRVFRHGYITINRKHIKTPKDLEGKRVGVPLYTMTAAVFMRGFLQHEYGINLSSIDWVEGAINAPTPHGRPTVLPVLKPVSISANNSGKSLGDLLAAGEISAIVGSNMPVAMRRSPDIQRLFPDFRKVEKDYFRRTRIFPIMHLVVIRRELYEQHPYVATNLFRALEESKRIAWERAHYLGALRYMLPWLADDLDEIDEVFGGDPWPYGVEPNRPTLEALVQYLFEQSLIAAPVEVDKLFAPVHPGH
jgi:4,5-dihydroxyphthalate decarboxylase